MHSIKTIFCHNAINDCQPNVAQRSLQSYACSIITVVYDKYYSACITKPKDVDLPRDLHLSRNIPKATKSHISKPQKAQILKPQAAKISLKRNSGVCNVYVNMTLKTVASIKYNARGKATMSSSTRPGICRFTLL